MYGKGGSITKFLKELRVDQQDISGIFAMCYDMGATKNYLLRPDVQEFIKGKRFVLMGSSKTPISNKGIEKVHLLHINKQLKEHIIVLELNNDKKLVWYEPTHFLDKKFRNNFPHGAFLAETPDLRQFHKHIEGILKDNSYSLEGSSFVHLFSYS